MTQIKNILLTAGTWLLCLPVASQVTLSNIELARNGDKAEITFRAEIDKNAVGKDYKLTLTPILSNGDKHQTLSPIVVESRRARIMDARNGVKSVPDALVTSNGQSVSYKAVIEYSEWLAGATLRIDKHIQGCCSEQDLPPLIAATNVQVYGSDAMSLRIGGAILILERNAPLPEQYSEKIIASPPSQIHLDRLNVEFAVGSSRLDPYTSVNQGVLTELIEILRTSKDVLSGKIEITGYASPEGQQAANYSLAQNRALAVRNYILDNVHYLRPADFQIINGGENWEGLRKLVEESRMPARWQVIDIIDTTPPDIDYVRGTSRKKTLMNLNGGQTWNYMLQHFFPQLRSAASIAIYKTVSTTQKSIDGNLLQQNSQVINEAISLIGERKTSGALAILSGVGNDPRSWNPMGVCYLLEGNIMKAKEYLQKAADAGYTEAKSNLEQLK